MPFYYQNFLIIGNYHWNIQEEQKKPSEIGFTLKNALAIPLNIEYRKEQNTFSYCINKQYGLYYT